MHRGISRNYSLIALVLLFTGTLPVALAGTNVPDWVKAAASEKLPEYSPKTEAVVLLEETTLNVQPNGKSTERVRRVVKILRPQGRNDADVVISFNSDSKVNSLHVWSIGPDGREYAMKDNEIIEVGRQEWGILYQDLRMKVAEPPGRDVNGIVAYEYEQKVPSYLSEESWDIQESIPKHIERFTLRLPSGWEYKTSWHEHAAVEPTTTPDGTTWELRDIPGLDLRDVPAAPAWQALCARGVISYFGGGVPRASGDWQAIGEHVQQLAQDRAQPTPEITAKAQSLIAGKTDFADKAQAIAEYVQHTRYVAILIGIGGLQPHAASDIFHSNSGDCKDKATLLAAMLASVGIHSTWMVVDTDRGVVNPDTPSMFGNHMIAAIQLPDGYKSDRLHSVVTAKSGKRFLIFDPTWNYTPFGTLESALQGGYGILVDGKDSQLIALPVLAPELNSIVRTATFKLTDDGGLSGHVTERRSGDIAADWRGLYSEASETDQRRQMVKSLGQDLGDFTLGKSSAENTAALTQDFIQKFDVTVPAYARQSGPLLLVRPRVFGRDSMNLDRKIRLYPIDLEETRTVKDEFDIELPPGYVVDELPDPVSVDMGFAAYQSRTELHGNTLHYARQCTIREVELPAEKSQALQHFIGEIEQDERSQAVFKKKEGS
jgi:hypothetical protein